MLLLDSPMLLRKKKTCPQCRGQVREAPVEAREIRSIVQSLHTSGLSSDIQILPDVAAAAERATGDPWKGIFTRNNADAGLRRLLEHANARLDLAEYGAAEGDPQQGDLVGFGGDRGVYDPEDGVYRCTRCHHEIVEGACTSCARLYPGLMPRHRLDALDFFDIAAEDEMSIADDEWWETEEFDDEDADLGFLGWEPGREEEGGPARVRLGSLSGDERSDDDDIMILLSDDDDDESYEGSFIDDGDDAGTVDAMVVERHPRSASRGSIRNTSDGESLEIEEGSEGEGDGQSDEDYAPIRRAPPRRGNARPIYISDDEDEDEVETISGGRGRGEREFITILSDDELVVFSAAVLVFC